jgi:hypothetical protein
MNDTSNLTAKVWLIYILTNFYPEGGERLRFYEKFGNCANGFDDDLRNLYLNPRKGY